MWGLVSLCMSLQALAEESEFEGTEKDVVEAVDINETTVVAEFGGSLATGNVVYYTVNGAVVATHRWKKNKLSGAMGIHVGKAVADGDGDGHLNEAERRVGLVENSRRYESEVRYDRFIGERDSLYLLDGQRLWPCFMARTSCGSHTTGWAGTCTDTRSTTRPPLPLLRTTRPIGHCQHEGHPPVHI